jgi:peptide/nickel transport system ATP-binding protein
VAPLLEITDLKTEIRLKQATVHAVDGVSLHVEAGETLGVVGESGCGKTMTALSIINLLPTGGRVTEGTIALNGRQISGLDDEQMRQVRGNEIGMIFQDPLTSLNPTMTVGYQIAEAVRLHRGASKQEALERAVEVLDLVGLSQPRERIGEYPHQFSGGMRQRVMIAMALSCEPKLLIADEPTTALDVTIQKQILELIDDLRHRLGMSVILVTHDLGVIAGRADRVAVMYAGKVAETTDTGSLFANPRHPYSEALFHALPDKAAETRERLYSIPGIPPDLTSPPKGCRFAPRCRYATDRCREQEPPLAGEEPGHMFACFYPVGSPEAAALGRATATPRNTAATGTVTTPAAGASGDAPPMPAADGRSAGGLFATGPFANGTGDGVLLSVEHLVKNFPVTRGAVLQRRVGWVSAVADVNFSIRRGETLGVVGESGCGKTTIGRLVVGLDKATSGAIRFEGRDLARSSGAQYRRERRDIQLMFQDAYASLDPRMRAGSVLREPLAVQHIGSRRDQQRRIEELLDQVGLPRSATERYPHEFSGGQRQRLGFARALTLNPKLIVADEPVSALDVSIQAQILNMMRELQSDLGLTYLFISHDLAVVRYVATQIAVMYLGKLVEIGPADEVYTTPAHPYTKGLIDSAPVPDPQAEQAKVRSGVTGELPSAIHPPSGCRFRTRCPLAQDLCAIEEPPLRPFSAGGHLAACHFPLQTALAADDAATASAAGPGIPGTP